MRQLAILRLRLQRTSHDLRPRADQRLLQLLPDNSLRDVLDVDPVAVDDAFHLLVHFDQEFLALFVNHFARHLQLVFFGTHDWTQRTVFIIFPPIHVELLRNIILTDR